MTKSMGLQILQLDLRAEKTSGENNKKKNVSTYVQFRIPFYALLNLSNLACNSSLEN